MPSYKTCDESNSNETTCIISIKLLEIWFFEDCEKSDVGKTTKTAPSGRTIFSHYLSEKMSKIGRETMEKSQI